MPVAASKSTANVVAARKLRVGRAVVPRPPDCGGRGHRFLQAGPCVPAMYLGFLVDLARLGHIPFERAGFPGSSRLRPLYESFPNRTGGKGAHPPIRPGIRDIYDSSATMEMMWYMRDRILTRIALAVGRFD